MGEWESLSTAWSMYMFVYNLLYPSIYKFETQWVEKEVKKKKNL